MRLGSAVNPIGAAVASVGRVSDFPSAHYLAEDFRNHVRVKELIERASQAAPIARPAR
jgi:hypothetical protein